ncbi:hypothetical protein [Oryzifoliimicrobium ureilyticus]|uniref:hypothetical protein n=1 Tax=Oryzifoliimicrobium ureilyticus TaxID=3113724 RepID=UPI00307629C5
MTALKITNKLGRTFGRAVTQGGGGVLPSLWILAANIWNDAGVWDDTAQWKD